MRLTQNAISAIKNDKRVRARLQLDLDRSEYTINRLIAENGQNSLLTTAAALRIIREETGLSDSEVLEDTKDSIAA